MQHLLACHRRFHTPTRAAVAPEEAQTRREWETIALSARNPRIFPWIAKAGVAGGLRLHGAFFDIRSGILSVRGDDDAFRPVST